MRASLEFMMRAHEHAEIPLWGEMAPPYHREDAVFPTVRAYLARGAKYAVVILPGGGYFQLSVGSEGVAVAKALNERGVSAFVVTYRYAPCDRCAILSDGRRAMQFVRFYAEDFGIDPTRIALMGFSAGGHLAMCVAEHPEGECIDEISKVDAHPDACILAYPVTTLEEGTFPTMPPIFLGEENTTLAPMYSYGYRILGMPPTFIWYSQKDAAANYVKNADALYAALIKTGIPSECHAFSDGGHGVGLGLDFPECAAWLDLAITFLNENL